MTGEEITRRASGKTLFSYIKPTAERCADMPMVRWKRGDAWAEWTWREGQDMAARIATALTSLGLERGERVALMMRNRPELYPLDNGTMLAGGTPFSIYNSSSPEQIQYIVDHSEATIAVVEDVGFLERFLKVRHELPHLRTIVIVDDPDRLGGDDVIHFEDLLRHDPIDIDAAASLVRPEDLATLVYTSGTTGPPKAAMISHANLCWMIESLAELVGEDWQDNILLSYLPMAHILERFTSLYAGMRWGGTVTTCPDVAQLADYLRETRPTILPGVPRVFEKIHAGLMAVLSTQPEEQRRGVEEAIEIGRQVAELRLAHKEVPADLQARYDEADASVFALVRSLVGFDRARFVSTGAAPCPVHLIWFFQSLGIPITEGYGMTESSCVISYSPYETKPGTVGKPVPGQEVRIADDGEVLVRGGNIFGGYLKDPEKTAEALDADGWLHTGDVGVLDDEGYLTIVDRKKELIITAGGKNISPANIEAALKSFPLVGQAAVIGDNRRFVSALIALDPEIAPSWATQRGIEGSLEDLAKHPDVVAEVQRAVDEANKRFSQVEQVKRFTILADEWVPDSDVLTPTMKLKRRGILARYADEIEAMYA